MSFSDDNEDLNVDFDMDTDDDDVRNDVPVPSSPDSPDMATQNSDSSDRSPGKNTNEAEETTDVDSVGHVEKDDQKKTEDSGSSSAVPITGKIWCRHHECQEAQNLFQHHLVSLFYRKE